MLKFIIKVSKLHCTSLLCVKIQEHNKYFYFEIEIIRQQLICHLRPSLERLATTKY